MTGPFPHGLLALILSVLFWLPACASRPGPPFQQGQPEGVRWGVLVATMEGEEILALRPDERFIPASNTKLFTTAAAFHYLPGGGQASLPGVTSLWSVARDDGPGPDLILTGGGDGGLADGPGCRVNCLHQLADAVLAAGITHVGDIIGDDGFLQASPWGSGWSWNNLVWSYAAPVSSLSVNGNALRLQVSAGRAPGDPAEVSWLPGDDLLEIDNRSVTSAGPDAGSLRLERVPGTQLVRITGEVARDTTARPYVLAVSDPAGMAARRLARLLEERGIRVEGQVQGRAGALGEHPRAKELARLDPQPLIDSLHRIQRDSDNLTAELVLRHVAAARGHLSPEGGAEVLAELAGEAGLSPAEADLYDGSGLSVYNRVTPRGIVAFLRWTSTQPWGDAWRATLPAAGLEGTLQTRFRGSVLEGRLFAKTGSLHGVNALSGFMQAASGRTLVFAILANDRPLQAGSATRAMDEALVQVALAN